MIVDRLGTREWIDVTSADAATLARVHPYYALSNGRPLQLVLAEDTSEGGEARIWLRRWLAASTMEQIEFCFGPKGLVEVVDTFYQTGAVWRLIRPWDGSFSIGSVQPRSGRADGETLIRRGDTILPW